MLMVVVLLGGSLAAPGAAGQEPVGIGSLAAPEEWIDLPYGQTAPLRTPPVAPVQVGPPDTYQGVVRAADGSQVAWAQRAGDESSEVVVADIWGGGRRVVHRTAKGVFVRPTALGFTPRSTAVVFVAGDMLRRVDVITGRSRTLASDDRFTVTEGAQGGPIDTVGIDVLPTGDVVVERACQTESCVLDQPLLWRRDTGQVQDLPYNFLVTHDGRRLVTVDNVDGEPVLRVAPIHQPGNTRSLATLNGFPSLAPGAIRHDDQVIALPGGDRGALEVRSLDDGALVASASPPPDATFVDGWWSPDGTQFLTTAVWQDPFERQPWVVDLITETALPAAPRDRMLLAQGWTAAGSPLVINDDGMWRVRTGGGLARVTRTAPDNNTQPRRPGVGSVGRYAGVDRVATAVTLSRAAFASADTVVVARADLYPDALAGSALAGQAGGPVLLTPSDGLDTRVADEVARVGASTAYVLGTREVMSRQVVQDLQAAGVDRVVRLGGPDRFDTAALVAGEVADQTSHVFVVEGADPDPARGWPDAVAVAGRAAVTLTPVLLTETDRLPAATRRAIGDLGVEHVTIVGGPVAVSEAVERELASQGVEVDRVAGTTRYATSAAVAEIGPDPTLAVLVTGSNWPDALAAGPSAAHVGGTVLLTPTHSITTSRYVEDYLNRHTDTLDRAAVAGSTSVVAQRVVRELATVLHP